MFVCPECVEATNHECIDGFRSYGPCEICRKTDLCYDDHNCWKKQPEENEEEKGQRKDHGR